MKKIILLLFISFSAFAGDIDGVCNGGSCTPQMEEILQDYREGSYFEKGPEVFSGECYHRSRLYNPNHAHFGGVLIDEKYNEKYFAGRFHFFAPDNPYRGLNVENARKRFNIKYEKDHVLTKKGPGYFIDLNKGKIPLIHFYFSKKDNELNLIGVWGVEHIFFCKMLTH